ncbi:putative multidrug efflux ABC transporter [Synechococcus sp. WH 8109]|uniref:ABC transporter transmembrane domain-containing protein n=1 Tax=Synechococcus sp. WH 8109 TaxID=166314 RepID=UPI0001B8D8AB|nr:peptidase domain-containing ABC transporter [Synechococcus sp. WH 8109]AHF62514.1 putative multidrug efflux ABC transporter [Synechococcus sp. WH 8109]
MTVYDPTTSLKQLEAFKNCSEEALQTIKAKGSRISFATGHSLSTNRLISDRVLVILSGRARLLGEKNGMPVTLGLMGPGSFIGLPSLLRAEACEEVSAMEPVEAWSISDTLIAELYRNEASFQKWCHSTLFPAELAAFLETLLDQSERTAFFVSDVLGKVIPLAKTLIASNEAVNQLDEQNLVFIGSGNGSWKLNEELQREQLSAIHANKEASFALRLITLPKSVVDELKAGPAPQERNDLPADETKQTTEQQPASSRSSLNLIGEDPRSSIELIRASGVLDETLACFRMLAQIMGLPFRRDALEKTIRDALRRGKHPSLPILGQLVAGMGLHVVGAKVPPALCTRMNVPCLMAWGDGFGVVVQSNANGMLMAHPTLGWVELTPDQMQESAPDGFEVILVDRTSTTPDEKFNFGWFIPAIRRHRSSLLLVLGSSFVVQLFTLANPLLIQVIIDKVISQRSLDTLQVLGIALVGVTIFEGVLGSLRTFLFTDTTNRIDMRLGSEVIDHLLRLPVGYFDRRPVGELGTRVAELEKIRNFLTGEALTTIIDAAFSVIYILVMALYSWILTIVALLVVPLQVAITLIGAPLFRRQFRQAAEANAKTQSHLVEVLTGIQTVKAQNVEIVSRWKWQERYGRYISRTFEKTITGTALGQVGQVLQKLSQLMVLWVGARLVLEGQLTLGQLIAFRIISGYVTQPLLRLSTIWQRIQELRVSFERLADIVDTPEESTDVDKGKIPLPPVDGKVEFKNLQFRFNSSAPQVLKNINLSISPGTFVGIVGQSGSGKSTLMKLLPRLYSPTEGNILIDNYDIDKVELYSLRRQIGIVPQEPLLFTGSVSDNIALTDPNASSEEIAKAAQIACAHEFIMGLPSGYSTELGERGANLSGGQRQRLAIARTLLANPKLLVMDEATSALDYDTERRVCQNLRETLVGCSVFFVTHRLSTVRNADLIVMMHQGAIVETGTHEELIALQGRYYALYRQQEAG